MRLDIFLSETRGISRNRAQFLISQGLVCVSGKTVTKTAYIVEHPEQISVVEDDRTTFVARSAVKLDRYLAALVGHPIRPNSVAAEIPGITISGKNCLDVGSSTGGFVQVLLKYGAKQVTALDVGTAQLHESLRGNPKIISIENTDFREYHRGAQEFDIITADVSFISLEKLLPAFARAAGSSTKLIILFKPQFEVGKENLTKQNLPKSEKVILEAMNRFRTALKEYDFCELDCRESELPGETGNREWIFLLQKTG